jgi:hypothetical protein
MVDYIVRRMESAGKNKNHRVNPVVYNFIARLTLRLQWLSSAELAECRKGISA